MDMQQPSQMFHRFTRAELQQTFSGSICIRMGDHIRSTCMGKLHMIYMSCRLGVHSSHCSEHQPLAQPQHHACRDHGRHKIRSKLGGNIHSCMSCMGRHHIHGRQRV